MINQEDYILQLESIVEGFLECFEPTNPPLFEGFDPAGEAFFVRVPDEVAELIDKATVLLDGEALEDNEDTEDEPLRGRLWPTV